MSKGKKLIALLLVAALAVGGYFAVKHFIKDDENEEQPADTVPVGAMLADDVSGILYVCGNETIELEKSGETWYLKSDHGFPVKQAYADTMAASAANLEAVRLVSESADDFAEYGLDAPDTAYVFTLADGSQVTYYLGDYNNVVGKYYLNIAGTEKTYLISGDFPDAFGYSLQDLADVKPLQTVSTQDIRDLTLTMDGTTTRIFNAPDGLKTVYSDIFTWFLDEKTPADAAAAVDLAGKAASFTEQGCASYRASADELAAFGLDAPALTAKFDYTVSERKETGETDEDGEPITETVTHDETMTLYVGAASKDGSLYAKTDLSDVVYLINADYLDPLREFDMSTLKSKRVCAVMSTDVASVDVAINGKSATITVERTGTDTDDAKNIYKLDGKEITSEKYDDFFAAIQSLSAEAYTDKAVSTEDAPIVVTFHTTRKGFETVTLRLAPYDKNFYTDPNGALVNKRDAEKIAKTFETIGE